MRLGELFLKDLMVMTFVPPPEPMFVAGQPYIYGLYYEGVNGWYIGKNDSGRADYMGSPSAAVIKAIKDAHGDVGLTTVPRPTKRLLWSPPGATLRECHDQEWLWIARAREHHDGPVFNLFPIQDWTDHFEWVHDEETHVDRATNSRWNVVYLKLQARCDADGNCSGGKNDWYRRNCGRPWGDQAKGVSWCKVVYPDAQEEWLQPPGTKGSPYEAFRQHKFLMINGSDTPPSIEQRAHDPLSVQALPLQSSGASGDRTERHADPVVRTTNAAEPAPRGQNPMASNDLTPALRDEIAHHLSRMDGRRGMVFRDMERGLDAEQIASSQGTNVANVDAHIRSIERLLCGRLPTTPSTALKEARAYNFLLGHNLSPALHNYVVACLRHLQALNPSVQIGPQQPGATRDVRVRRSIAPHKTCPDCGLAHAGECL